jgi:outer membrane protein OmpA-like peptidoglycan-associated protein
MRLLSLLACAPLALAQVNVYAQGEAVLRDKDVNEATLIEALTPEPTFRTRSIRISPDSSGSPAAPVKRPAASMLITFETGSAVLKPQSRKMLDSLGRAMTSDKLSTYKFAVEGHADPRGGDAANLELSQRRAEAVVSYLTENHRIDPGRLRPVGKGQSELFNLTQVDAPENRRVTVKTLLE